MRTRFAIRSCVVLVLVGLLGAACGTRVGTEERTARRGVAASPATTAASSAGPKPDTTDTTPAPGEPSEDKPPCGPGDAKGATDVGVTGDSITIYTIQDISGPQPGLFQAPQDAMVAFVAYCNSLGGINGRELKLEKRDSTFFEPRPPWQEACGNALALVGATVVLDDQVVDLSEKCGLPEFPTASATSAHALAPNVVHANPAPPTQWNAGLAAFLAEHFPEEIERSAMFYADLGTTKNLAFRQMEAFEQFGHKWTLVKTLPLIELNWGPHVEELRAKEIGYVGLWTGLEEPAKLVKELRAQGVTVPVVDIQGTSYDQKFIDLAGAAAEGAYVAVATWPFEEADQNRELQNYVEWLGKTAKSEPTGMGVATWSAGLFFATVVKELGSEVTREALLEKALEVHEWDGHGLHGPGDPGANKMAGCTVVLQVRDGGFTRVWPDEGFACDDSYAATVKDPSAAG